MEPDNRFGLPDFNLIYEKVRDYVEQHQGKKGYIITYEEMGGDSPWVMYWTGHDSYFCEEEIQAVRVKDGGLQILFQMDSEEINDEDIPKMDEDAWVDITWDYAVCRIPTIVSIAEQLPWWVEEIPEPETTDEIVKTHNGELQ